ncbi:DUF2804 domain-containing protein [Shewanella sp. NIFS-20-20]|uniref:DUF2804 domain-containing protein n=1 Tax=Shewanella sp. NIFS-20-20 TaxID=2853806 RepID=UPI001C480C3C|nr:DUF2804 domain-containing protein [Shewanella sp. NIFS-20-20]MBV7315914.1 DUF2804 domain-containing protein [Shewanella sp. NIFS-20-20]
MTSHQADIDRFQPCAPLLTTKAPAALIGANGQPQFGHFDGPVASLNLADFDYQTCMDTAASKLAKYFHYKQFQFVSIRTRDYILGVALADIRYLGSGFAYSYHINSNQLSEMNWLSAAGYQTQPSPLNSLGKIGHRHGQVAINIVDGCWHLRVSSADMNAELSLTPMPLSLPLALCNPTGYSGWTYTQKHNALAVKGRLEINGTSVSLIDAIGGYDFSAGYMRRDTSWRWASMNALTDVGTIGFNLAAGVNETGLTENVFWCNGERHLLGPVHFEFNRKAPSDPWLITSVDGRVNLRFSGLNHRSEKRDLWLLRSNFRQNIGRFSGDIIDNNGRLHQFSEVFGLSEDHYARW